MAPVRQKRMAERSGYRRDLVSTFNRRRDYEGYNVRRVGQAPWHGYGRRPLWQKLALYVRDSFKV